MIGSWSFLVLTADNEQIVALALHQLRLNESALMLLETKRQHKKDKKPYGNNTIEKIDFATTSLKHYESTILKKQKQNEAIKAGNLNGLNVLVLPGYTLINNLKIDADKKFYRALTQAFIQLEGRKEAKEKTKHVVALSMSYTLLGMGLSCVLGALASHLNDVQTGLIVTLIASLLVLVYAYSIYDDVLYRLKQRRAQLLKDFPQVVSKLALLMSAGMEMTRAWAETAHSGETPLYSEMQHVIKEMNNNVSATDAYTAFIHRCSIKETTKLATSLIQNLSKGNDDIAHMLTNLSKESWQERKHRAKRQGEETQSKLALPMMLMFVGILVYIMAPIVTNMGAMGF